MAKLLFCLILLCTHFKIHCQDLNPQVSKIDSLIKISKSLSDQKQFESALNVLEYAKKAASELDQGKGLQSGKCLAALARIHHLKSEHEVAMTHYEQALLIEHQFITSASNEYCVTALNYSRLLIAQKKFNQAESLLLTITSIRNKYTGKNSIETALAYANLADLYNSQLNNSLASKYYKLAITKSKNQNSLEFASILNKSGIYNYKIKEFNAAQKQLLQSSQLYLKFKGKNSVEYANSLKNLGAVALDQDNYLATGNYLYEALNIFNLLQDSTSTNYLQCLNNIGSLNLQLGEFGEASKYYHIVLQIREKLYKNDFTSLAKIYYNLGSLAYKKANYFKSEYFHLKADSILIKNNSRQSEDFARNLDGLANTYQSIGNFQKAELSYLSAIKLLEQTIGIKNSIYTTSIYNLSSLYLELNEYHKADSLITKALKLQKEVQGKYSLDYGRILSLYAELKFVQNNCFEALNKYNEVLAIYSVYFSKNNINFARINLKYTHIQIACGHHLEGFRNLQSSKNTILNILGEINPDYLLALDEEIYYFKQLNKITQLKQIYLERNRIQKELITEASLYLSEDELFEYTKQYKTNIDDFNSFASQFSENEQPILRTCLENASFYKGFILNSVIKLRNIIANDSNLLSIKTDIKYLKTEQIKLQMQSQDKKLRIKEIERLIQIKQKELIYIINRNSIEFPIHTNHSPLSLKNNEILVEFIQYNSGTIQTEKMTQYAALLLNHSDSVYFVPLCSQKELLDRFNGPLQGSGYVKEFYLFNERGIAMPEDTIKGLYEILWKPLEKIMQSKNQVYYVPTGLMHRINIGALSIKEDEIISDRYKLIQLQSSNDLNNGSTNLPSIKNALIFGGIHYSVDSTNSKPWSFLKWSYRESQEIDVILNKNKIISKLKTHNNATEQSLQSNLSSGNTFDLVHLATHGFFLSYKKSKFSESNVTYNMSDLIGQQPDPLLRSGLILYGANDQWNLNSQDLNQEDGILTAFEISQLDLSNTKLVVLSACETALGDIHELEGVYGLQRAIKIAGAKNIIMSLWQVPDKETSSFMVTFYKKWIEEKEPLHDAFYNTQKEMRERFVNPYQWAGFILLQ